MKFNILKISFGCIALFGVFSLVQCSKTQDLFIANPQFKNTNYTIIDDIKAVQVNSDLSFVEATDSIVEYGFAYTTNNVVALSLFGDSLRFSKTMNGKPASSSTFTDTLFDIGLTGTNYIRPYAKTNFSISYGDTMSITPSILPTFTEAPIASGPANFMTTRLGAFTFSFGNEVVIGGGTNSNSKISFYNCIKFINAFDSVPVAPIPDNSNTAYCASFVIDSIGYLVTGLDNDSVSAKVLAYNNNTNTWSTKNPFPEGARFNSSAVVVNGEAYVGFGDVGGNSYLSDLYKYNATNDTWTKLPVHPNLTARTKVSMFAVGTKIYVVGGNTAPAIMSSQMFEFNTINNSWIQLDDTPFTSAWCATFSNSNVGYLCFGSIKNGSKTYAETILGYVPASKKWFVYYDGNKHLIDATNYNLHQTFVKDGKPYLVILKDATAAPQIYKVQ